MGDLLSSGRRGSPARKRSVTPRSGGRGDLASTRPHHWSNAGASRGIAIGAAAHTQGLEERGHDIRREHEQRRDAAQAK